jgi:hypothetical protein
MRVFVTKSFARFARKEGVDDVALRDVIHAIDRGMIDAELGGFLFKQRVARTGRGKSGGYRVILVYRIGARAVFLFGFAKNERDNISKEELAALKHLGSYILKLDNGALAKALKSGELTEVKFYVH